MKKAIFTLAILAMAFGNASFAQRKANLKLDATQNVLKHYGLRDETTIVPETAEWQTLEGEQYRTAYTYDEYDYYLLEEFTEYNEGNGWNDMYQISYEYDFAGNVIEMMSMSAFESGVMQNEARATLTYDDFELSEVVIQYWENGDWVNEEKQVYNYNGDVTTVLYWEWNGSNWASNELYTYTYGNGSVELLIQYMQGGAWQNDEKQLMTLNFDERITEILVQEWVNPSWVNEELTTYNYEGNVFPTKTVQQWNGSAWENDVKFEYAYDGNGNAVSGLCLGFGGGEWVSHNGDIEMPFANGEKSNEYYGFNVDVKFVDLTGVNENATAMNLSVFPLPAQGEVSIKADGFAKAEIYNMAGQKLMESLSETVNVSMLPTGLYIIKVYDRDGGMASLKMPVR